MTLVAGIDSSTQSCKVVVCDADTGAVVREGRAPHPDGTEAPPSAWWDALMTAGNGLWDDVAAVAVAGQQHGMVVVDGSSRVVRDALLWNDTRSAGAADDLIAELGGPEKWAEAVGLVPVASFTVTKLRWLAEHEPDAAARVERVMLPHDWLTWKLLGQSAEPVTDRGDASGTGYWSPLTGEYRPDLLRAGFGREIGVPRVARPAEAVGVTAGGFVRSVPDGITVAPGTGDNMGAALGLGAEAGDVVVSIGTSGTAFAVSDTPAADASGAVAGFADATGRFLPLVATLNAARVLTATAELLGIDTARLDDLALSAAPGAGGLVLLPYLDGERSPNLPTATGTLTGLTRAAMNPANVARAAVEGMLCGLADGVDALRGQGVGVRRVLLIGGGAASRAVREVAAGLFGVPVIVPVPGEYVARGAARQAAWVLSGIAEPPAWEVAADPLPRPDTDGRPVREAYAAARATVHGAPPRPR